MTKIDFTEKYELQKNAEISTMDLRGTQLGQKKDF